MLRLLIGKDRIANRDAVMGQIARDVREKKGGRILMVPELISHEMERRLCAVAGDTASRFAEVLSFTRLARRVSDETGGAMECLDNGGRVVAMAAAARQMHSVLKAYASVETKPEFLMELIDAVDEFKRCCISSADLADAAQRVQGGFAQKLEELSLIMEGYDSICARGKRDPRDRETRLLEQLEEGNFAQRHVFYIDGFPDFTRQHLALLEHMIRVSPQVTVSLNCDEPGSSSMAFEKAGATALEIIKCAQRAGVEVQISVVPGREDALAIARECLFQGTIVPSCAEGQLQTFRAESVYDECLSAAYEIAGKVREGYRYRDITVVCGDLNAYAPLLRLVFHRMGIPMYEAGTEDILQKSVIQTVLCALDAALGGFSQRETVLYLRSAFSPLEADICDDVENYAFVWAVQGSAWMKKWENHPDGLSGVWDDDAKARIEKLNTARDEAIAPLARLALSFREAKSLRAQVSALYVFLENIHMEERLAALADEMEQSGDGRNAQILNQLWEILLSALEQLYDVLGDTVWEGEHFAHLLRLLLSRYDVGTIPPVLDAVQVGAVSAMHCHEEKHLIVLGAEEGMLPGYSGSSGVLTDQERDALRALGVPLTGGSLEGIQAEFAEIYGVFCGARETVSVYCSSEQPSYVFRRLAQMAGGVIQREDTLGFACADEVEAGAYLARFGAHRAARELNLEKAYEDVCKRRAYALGRVSRKNVEALYGKTLNLSASQIDRQAECRFAYFLKYGLRARERLEAKIDPAQFGTYVHAVLENTAHEIMDNGGFHTVTCEQTLEIAHKYSREYAQEHFAGIDSERMHYLFARNTQELDMVIAELWQELSASLFEPRAFELNFGSEDGLPPIPIENKAMNAIVRGFIDRMDTWEEHGNTYYRVVDYKTGKKDFDYCDVFNGVGLQMLIYLFALKHSGVELLGTRPIAAGVQYFPARVPYLSADGRLDEEAASDARQKQWKRKGLIVDDENVIAAMQPEGAPQRIPYTVKKDGTISGDIASREQMQILEGYVYRVLAKMVEQIASGDIEPNPYTRGTSHDACAFCPYGAICHKDSVPGRRNYKAMTSQRFWEEVEKEMTHHGG